MWKALIKLVESWSYRCDHNYELVTQEQVYNNGKTNDTIPDKIYYKYRCTKCCDFKVLS